MKGCESRMVGVLLPEELPLPDPVLPLPEEELPVSEPELLPEPEELPEPVLPLPEDEPLVPAPVPLLEPVELPEPVLLLPEEELPVPFDVPEDDPEAVALDEAAPESRLSEPPLPHPVRSTVVNTARVIPLVRMPGREGRSMVAVSTVAG